jgi:hypothetical protein
MATKQKELTKKIVARIRSVELSRYLEVTVSQRMRIAQLFDCAVGRVYLKVSTDDEQFRKAAAKDADKVSHIVDWLVSSVLGDAPWLSKTDTIGRPKKIMKCGTIDALAREADAWSKQQANRRKVTPLDPHEEDLFMELRDGWRIVKMKTPSSLDRESGLMQHCVGDGAYDAMLRDHTAAILSLRDYRNQPHVTVQIDLAQNKLVQVWGKANTIPKAEYSELMRPFFLRHGYWRKRSQGIDLMLFDLDGGVHVVDQLAEGVTLRAIDNISEELLKILPPRITVKGDISFTSLDIRDHIRRGFGGMSVWGRADMSWANIGILPARHGFMGDIDLSGADVRGIEDGFRCHGTLKVAENARLRTLPHRMVVNGDLIIRETPLSALPEDLSVRGNLAIRGTEIRRVPKTVRVGGTVSFSRW